MKLFYRQYGQGHPLIILHGLFGLSDNWTTLAKQFGENGFAVHTFDLRNHGQSPWSDEFSYELMVNDVVETISNLHLPISILGHSMGAKVAMLLALNHPDKVDKLIAVDMAPKYYPPHHQYIFNAIHALGDMSQYKSRKEVEQKFSNAIPEVTKQFLLKNLYWKNPDAGAQNFEPLQAPALAWRFNVDVIERNVEDMSITASLSFGEGHGVRPFTKPTLFVKGENSAYVTPADEPEIKYLFPQAIFKTIPGAGHWVHADKPKEFFEASLDFLK